MSLLGGFPAPAILTHRTAGLDTLRPSQSNVAAFGCSHRAWGPPSTWSAVSLLVALAGCTLLIRFNYDVSDGAWHVRKRQRIQGAMNRHFPMNAMTPMVLFINPRDTADTRRLPTSDDVPRDGKNCPNIVMVRSLTRPNVGNTSEGDQGLVSGW